MRKAITLLLFLIPSIFFGQETIRITNKKTNEVYYVLKSDTSIRQGIYKKWGWNDKSKIEGFYKNGVRDSIWSFYDTKGHIEQQYNFTKKETVFYIDLNPFKNTKSAIINGSDTTKVILTNHPIILEGKHV
jgi:antitoxin component YwqK of YwqJK toxin-antitoxin module